MGHRFFWAWAGLLLAAGLFLTAGVASAATTWDVQANGFNKNERVALWAGLSDGSTVSLGETRADASGAVEFTVSAGDTWPAGDVLVVAHGLSSGHETTATFTASGDQVDRAASPSDTSTVTADSTYTYVGTGYKPGERVATWFQYPSERGGDTAAHALADVYADSSGQVTFDFTLASDWEYGQYHITARGTQSGRVTSNTFTFFGTITGYPEYWSITPATTASGGTGWTAEYYDNADLAGTPVLTRVESGIAYDWGLGSPDSSVPVDDFSARWTGTRYVGRAGNYTLTATADDGLRVYVDGNLVLDEWQDQPATTFTETFWLDAGNHTVTVEYYEHTLYAVANVQLTAD